MCPVSSISYQSRAEFIEHSFAQPSHIAPNKYRRRSTDDHIVQCVCTLLVPTGPVIEISLPKRTTATSNSTGTSHATATATTAVALGHDPPHLLASLQCHTSLSSGSWGEKCGRKCFTACETTTTLTDRTGKADLRLREQVVCAIDAAMLVYSKQCLSTL